MTDLTISTSRGKK